MENQEKLEKGIGTKEIEALKPAKVKIEKIEIVEVPEVKADKIVCSVKHPDQEDEIHISRVKYLKRDNLVESGLWYTEDSDGLISKNSALAEFMRYLKVKTLKEMEGKEAYTVTDKKGYLEFKAY